MVVDIDATKEVDPVAKSMMKDANAKLNSVNAAISEDMSDLTDPKKQKSAFSALMKKYSTPCSAITLGMIGSIAFGVLGPMYGWWIMACMNELNAGYGRRLLAEAAVAATEALPALKAALDKAALVVAAAVAAEKSVEEQA